MRPHALNRRIASRHVSDDSIVIVDKTIPVTNLPARLGIKRRVIEDDLARSPALSSCTPCPS